MIGVGTYSNMEHLVSILSMDVHLLCIGTCIHDIRYMIHVLRYVYIVVPQAFIWPTQAQNGTKAKINNANP